ncbi:adenosine deaminase [Veronia nyctiphanis]|uniref:Adenine deaminase n=1 Tax=Veronia nyctiphanis TaxID=1278244 RepID=A0A4Q0YTB4_9GAMM|nr:adenosine deaminase [Veronia nyctiphanis]RXJ72389.1 adenosine deaminase [Veronia nyctiphanis]
MEDFIRKLPKVELHLHIEGSLEPELMFTLAERNNISLPYASVEEARNAYQFTDLQSFLDIYYQGANVLQTKQDFFDLTWAYLLRCQEDNVIHTEIFFDPQTHTQRGIPFATVVAGISDALEKAEKELGISSLLIMCFLRHLSEQDAFDTLEQAKPHLDKIVAVGLDSSELGHPPEKFSRVFSASRQLGLRCVAHAGEEGPPANIRSAIDDLHVERIDHGVKCASDRKLVDELARMKMPLTVCPLSNIKLCVFSSMEQHNFLYLLKKGVCVTINSDDPAFFGGYMTDNFLAVHKALNLTRPQLVQCTMNAIEACFLNQKNKKNLLKIVESYY